MLARHLMLTRHRSEGRRCLGPVRSLCTAFVVDPVNDPPSVMMRLPVIKKTTQKGD